MAGSTHHRVSRVSSLLRDVLGELIVRELRDPRVQGVTVTDVEISSDLGDAKVYVTGVAEAGRRDALRGLDNASGFLRREIGRRVQLRTLPQLRFYFDESMDYGARIDAALREIGLSGAGPARIETDEPATAGDVSTDDD
jgi:ribosome-binding factor A